MEAGTGETLLSPEESIGQAWQEIIEPLIAEGLQERGREILKETFEAYAEEVYPGIDRHYHTIEHIAICLEIFQPYRGRPDAPQLFLALLWHDVIYKTDPENSPFNEIRSAEKAYGYMQKLGLPGGEDTSRLIISTKEHKSDKEDEQLVCGIDMLTLALQPFEEYLRYSSAVGKEYAWIPHEIYAEKRPEILLGLVKDGGPYQHPDFLHENPIAIENVHAEIAQLQSN